MGIFGKSKNQTVQEPMDLDAVMKKFDRESNTRIWEGKPKIVVTSILALFSLFCIYVTLFTSWLEEIRLTSFVAFIILIGYIVFPAKKGQQKVNHMPWYDIVLLVITALCGIYIISAGMEGYMYKNMPVWERVMALAGGLLMIIPGWETDVAGVALMVLVIVLQKIGEKKEKIKTTAKAA